MKRITNKEFVKCASCGICIGPEFEETVQVELEEAIVCNYCYAIMERFDIIMVEQKSNTLFKMMLSSGKKVTMKEREVLKFRHERDSKARRILTSGLYPSHKE
jgi:hypothetical protein